MPNEFIIKNGYFSQGNSQITGSLTIAAGTSATQFSVTSGSTTEFLVTGTGVTIGSIITDTHRITGSLSVSGSITGSLFGTASFATNTNVDTAASDLYLFYNY